MRASLVLAIVLTLVSIGAPDAAAGNFMVHVQGRGWSGWNDEVPFVAGWQTITLPFNGNAKLNGPETNTTVRNALVTYCTSGNNCIVHCYSAGCLRVLKAVSDLRASGNGLGGLLWVEGSASAAGGTKLASVSTSGFTSLLAKLIGQQEQIDFDLTPSAARGTWGFVQDDLGVMLYHVAGRKDVCKKLLFWKICGNKYVDAGTGDGVVGLDSASGASSAGYVYDGCAAPKYPYRAYDTYDGVACGGEERDHFGMPGRATKLIGTLFASSYLDAGRSWGDLVASAECAGGECDAAFESAGQDFSKTPSLQPIAGDVSAYASNTTGPTGAGSCSGKCGGYAGSCWCDAACGAYGDCCGDYGAANCAVVAP